PLQFVMSMPRVDRPNIAPMTYAYGLAPSRPPNISAVAIVPASIGSTESHCCHRAPVCCGMTGGGSSASSPEGSGGAARRGGRLMTSVLTPTDVSDSRPGPGAASWPGCRLQGRAGRRPSRPGRPAGVSAAMLRSRSLDRRWARGAYVRQTLGMAHGNPHPDPPGVDLAKLEAYLKVACPDLAAGQLGGPLAGELIAGGKSNLTYRIWGADRGSTVVLRRPPLGHVLPTAHDMAREYRVIAALHPTGFPVPTPIHLCPDADVI